MAQKALDAANSVATELVNNSNARGGFHWWVVLWYPHPDFITKLSPDSSMLGAIPRMVEASGTQLLTKATE